MIMNSLRYMAADPKDTAIAELDHILIEHAEDLRTANAESEAQAIQKKLDQLADNANYNRDEHAAFLRKHLIRMRDKVEEQLDDEIRMLNESPALSQRHETTPDNFHNLLDKLNKAIEACYKTQRLSL